jgi:LmbE family N-acetylglucosaminyl deacetylase
MSDLTRVLALIPHPDDESYAMAGTLHEPVRSGAVVDFVCATRGEHGDDFSSDPGDDLAAQRSAELAASCEAIGAVLPRFLDLPDGGLFALPAGRLEAALINLLSKHCPGVVLTIGPDGAYGHQDRLRLTEVVSQALAWINPAPRLLQPAFPAGLFLPQWRRMTDGENAGLVAGEPPPVGVDAAAVDLRIGGGASRAVERASIGVYRLQLSDGTPESLFPVGIMESLLEE